LVANVGVTIAVEEEYWTFELSGLLGNQAYNRAVRCRVGSANCKCSHGQWLGGPRIVVGDGRSDFCMADRARFVIAKGTLAEFCRAHGLAHASFRNFDDATRRLAEWLDLKADRPADAPASRRSVRPRPNGMWGKEPGV